MYHISMAKKKNPSAVLLGKLGGIARAKKMTPEERSQAMRDLAFARAAALTPERRSEIAKKAVAARIRKLGQKKRSKK